MLRKFASGSHALLAAGFAFAIGGCEGAMGPQGPQGAPGANGNDGVSSSCTVTSDNGVKTISCSDGTIATISNGLPGAAGADGAPCTLVDNHDGTSTVTCGTTSVVLSDGQPGASCTADVVDGSKTITCGNTSIIVTDGSDGTDGVDGTSCTIVKYFDGHANIECTDGTLVTVLPASNSLAWDAPLPGVHVSVIAVEKTAGTGNFAAGDTLKVTFKAEDTAGTAIPLAYLDRARVWLSGPTSSYQHILPSTNNSSAYDMLKTPKGVQNADGTITYTFPNAIPATVPSQLYSTGAFPQGSLAGQALPDGTYTVTVLARRVFNIDGRTVRDVGFAQQNVLVGAASTVEAHEVVTDADCNACHRTVQAHGGGYRSTQLCVTCHAAGAEATDVTGAPVSIEFAVMVHKIHDGLHLPSVNGVGVDASGNRTYGTAKAYTIANTEGYTDFSTVNFPVFPSFSIARPRNAGYSALSSANKTKEGNLLKGVTNCDVCHGGASQGTLATTAPSRRVCGACHDDIDWTKDYLHNWNGSTDGFPGAGKMGAQTDDDGCVYCHTGTRTAANHVHPLQDPAVNPDLVMAVTAVTGGTGTGGNFKAGDKIAVTFSITDGTGATLPASALDSATVIFTGPNQNRNAIFPQATASSTYLTPFDVSSGRLATADSTNKGAMTKVVEGGATTSAALKVQFSSGTAFAVTDGSGTSLGSGTLAAATAVAPSGMSLGSVVLASDVVAPQDVRVTFSSKTDFLVEADSGSGYASIGTGKLPASKSATVLFASTDGKIQFIVTVGSTEVTVGTTTLYLTIFRGTGNQVLFGIIPGTAAFAGDGAGNDRFYYDYVAPAASYTMQVPMDIPWELLGYGSGSAGQTFTAGNLPVYFGRQTVYAASTFGAALTVGTYVKPFDRWAFISDVSGISLNDFFVFEPGTQYEEYLRVATTGPSSAQVPDVDPTVRKVKFTTVFRYAHNPGAVVKRVTAATLMQEGVDYTLAPATGVLTTINPVAGTTAWFMSYRTDGAFGWKRKAGDTVQAVYGPALNYTGAFGEPYGVWAGKPYIDGTYNFAMWGYRALYVADQGEVQTYRSTSRDAEANVLYGSATTATPYAMIESRGVCNDCHVDLSFHGGGRRGGETCLTCHSLAGMEDGSGVTFMFRNFLHEAHAEGLPAMPNGSQHCDMCHGAATTWSQPTDHTYPGRTASPAAAAGNPTWNYAEACSGCHDEISTAGGAHIDAMISPFTMVESCEVCHGSDKDLSVARMHPSR